MKTKAYTRSERKDQIILAMALERRDTRYAQWTMYRIAHELNMSPSNHLMTILREMVRDGDLLSYEAGHRPGWNKTIFILDRTHNARQLPVREIRVFSHGGTRQEKLKL